VCIGTDRSTGDSLGPLVGTKFDSQQKNPYEKHIVLPVLEKKARLFDS
jgi:putative sporulation protein YyaC